MGALRNFVALVLGALHYSNVVNLIMFFGNQSALFELREFNELH